MPAGGSGNDTIRGNSADNVLDGNAGDDTAVFSGNRSSYTIENLGNRVVVTGPDGTDTLFSIEHVKFADTTVDLNAPAALTRPLVAGRRARSHRRRHERRRLVQRSDRQVDLWKIANGQWAGSVDVGPHPLGWQPAGFGDLNGDGTNDLLWHNPSTGNVDLWKLVNGQWAGSVDIGSHPLGYQVAGIADFDLDGTSDILWYNPPTGDRNLENLERPLERQLRRRSSSARLAAAGIGDFDHDGTDDVAWYNSTTRNIDIWQIVNGHWSCQLRRRRASGRMGARRHRRLQS